MTALARPVALLALCLLAAAPARPPDPPGGAVQHVHDPVAVRDGAYTYVLSTGHGIHIRRSRDLRRWEYVGRVFKEDVPAWAKAEIPKADMLWAPDVVKHRGRYVVTYSVSTFGSNRSIIGMASSPTMDPARRDYAWRDEGKVWESRPGDNYNAIDSQLVPLSDGRVALFLGSFWSGIKLIYLDGATLEPVPDARALPIAFRPGSTAVEAPYAVRRGPWWYLFASFDLCCRGVESTYSTRVGRARSVEGPYVDRDGKAMTEGGGTLVLGTRGRVVGPGHCAVLADRGRHWLVHHFYDADAKGTPTLQVRPLTWSRDGWPAAGAPVGE